MRSTWVLNCSGRRLNTRCKHPNVIVDEAMSGHPMIRNEGHECRCCWLLAAGATTPCGKMRHNVALGIARIFLADPNRSAFFRSRCAASGVTSVPERQFFAVHRSARPSGARRSARVQADSHPATSLCTTPDRRLPAGRRAWMPRPQTARVQC
jgi:hypothetical protein